MIVESMAYQNHLDGGFSASMNAAVDRDRPNALVGASSSFEAEHQMMSGCGSEGGCCEDCGGSASLESSSENDPQVPHQPFGDTPNVPSIPFEPIHHGCCPVCMPDGSKANMCGEIKEVNGQYGFLGLNAVGEMQFTPCVTMETVCNPFDGIHPVACTLKIFATPEELKGGTPAEREMVRRSLERRSSHPDISFTYDVGDPNFTPRIGPRFGRAAHGPDRVRGNPEGLGQKYGWNITAVLSFTCKYSPEPELHWLAKGRNAGGRWGLDPADNPRGAYERWHRELIVRGESSADFPPETPPPSGPTTGAPPPASQPQPGGGAASEKRCYLAVTDSPTFQGRGNNRTGEWIAFGKVTWSLPDGSRPVCRQTAHMKLKGGYGPTQRAGIAGLPRASHEVEYEPGGLPPVEVPRVVIP